jgi:carbamoyl-phosphate synthase small subunit
VNGIRQAVLVLENGKYFTGTGFGSTKTVAGELVVNTATAAGYNAILTDPSNQAQIVMLTYPPIGNYGVPAFAADEFGIDKHFESDSVKARGLVVFECCKKPFHWESVKTLDTFLKEQGVPGIEGVDTRAIATLLRNEGLQKSILQVLPEGETPDIPALQEAVQLSPDVNALELVAQVSTKEIKVYNENAPDKVVLLDLGLKNYMIRQLCLRKFSVIRVPHDTPYESIMKYNPKGVVISSGPGDPTLCKNALMVAKQCMDKGKPLFGIGLGHEIIALAAGAKCYRLKSGHRGSNKPCIDIQTKYCYTTSQNHTYAVDPESLKPTGFQVSFINADDKTVEGLSHSKKPVFSVQFHPEASPGSRDPAFLFNKFEKLMRGGSN